MDGIQDCGSWRRILLVGVPLVAGDGARLLSWAVGVAARRRDVITALHVLEEEERPQLRRAKAFVIALLAEFAGVCEAKEVMLEAKVVVTAGGVARALLSEADRSSASSLVIGASRSSSFEVMNYCFAHAPDGCAVIAVASPGEHDEKGSPRTVLDCHSSPSSTDAGRRRRRRSLWRRLSDAKIRLPFLPSPDTKAITGACAGNAGGWKCFRYGELAAATSNFHPDNMVGKGGYSEVYRGVLTGGHSVAVKRLQAARSKADGKKEQEFLAEVGILGHLSHPNTARLLGCCMENGLYLVFPFCSNGTLSAALHGKSGTLLDWPLRYRIAAGVARGLHYLHRCCRRRIIHRDIKAANVLLGDDFEPQISDFGLARWLPRQWTHHSLLPIEGTFGYLAPEYFSHGIVNEKTDMFAFGVLLLEIATGRKPIDCSNKQNLLQWAKPLLDSGRTYELVDPRLGMNYDKDQLKRMLKIASDCIRRPSMWRPTISEVLDRLSADHGGRAVPAEDVRMLESEFEELQDLSI